MKNEKIKEKNAIIGNRIYQLRYDRYFTQVSFASCLQFCGLDIDPVTLLNIEKGKRKLLVAEIPYFAKALKMSITEFVENLFEE